MLYEVRLHPEAEKEFLALDGSVRLQVAKQLKKLETSPELGEGLGNKNGIDLSGYKKLYVAKKSVRIVYRVVKEEIQVYVVSIGKREELQAYKEALSRLTKSL